MAEKLPVIFYIHGGEFEQGASNTFPGHMLAAVGDVVVVTVNYRLGALGNTCIFHCKCHYSFNYFKYRTTSLA